MAHFIPSTREGVILAILINGERYGRDIRNEYRKRTGTDLPLGSLYTTLERMRSKGFLKPRMGESAHERGGNRRRYYRVTAAGTRAFDALGAGLAGARGIADG